MNNEKALASRYWSKAIPTFWVESIKGRVGDWGYTTDSKRALALTPGQQARFASDCRHAGVVARFLNV